MSLQRNIDAATLRTTRLLFKKHEKGTKSQGTEVDWSIPAAEKTRQTDNPSVSTESLEDGTLCHGQFSSEHAAVYFWACISHRLAHR